MMTSQFNRYKAPRWMTTQILIGSLSLSMLAQVRFFHHLFPKSSLIRTIDFRANRPSDVVSTLVSIYDSRDLFIRELQVLLAQRLLAVTDGSYEKEVRLCLCPVIIGYLIAHA